MQMTRQRLNHFRIMVQKTTFLIVTTICLLFGNAVLCSTVLAQELPPELKVPSDWADLIDWRSIGPANMSGRITALAVYEEDPCLWWAATASGGLLKTTNNGVTFEHQFDSEATVSIGDVQVAQSNPDVIWVGTGEGNPRNSVSWGDGVYKSTDGGETWENMGLKEIFQTGALAIHPEDENVVYVGALGRLWGPNQERGLYKTTDGGETWNKVLYVNDRTGVIDVQLNPSNPDEILVATYERKRDGFDGNDPAVKYGEGSGIYKSTDGGESFTRLSEGLPTCKMGRIGFDYYRADPNYIVAIIESEKIATEPDDQPYGGFRAEDADVGAKITDITGDGPFEAAGVQEEDIIVSMDGEILSSYDELITEMRKRRSGDRVTLLVLRDREEMEIEVEFGKRPENGRSRQNDFTGTLGGQSANRQDQQGPEGFEYGGVYLTENGGESWERINTLNPRPMYYSHIRFDPSDRNYIYVCGTSLYKSSDGGETFTGDGGTDGIHVDHHALWVDPSDGRHIILGNDGGIYVTQDRMTHWHHHNKMAIGQFYHVGVDARMRYNVYGGLQDNGSWGGPSISPTGQGIVNSDWFRVGGGDGFITLADPDDADQIYFESQNGGMGRINLRTGARGFIRPRAPRGSGIRYRFNWKSPFILSPHNSRVYYSAGNHVFRSFDKGNDIKQISPVITNTDRGAGSALSESPVQAGVIYVGTTDGAVWMTDDGGNNWEPLYYVPESDEEEESEEGEESAEESSEATDEEGSSEEAAEVEPATEAAGESSAEEGDDEEAAEEAGDAMEGDGVSGSWTGRMMDDRIPEDRAEFSFTFNMNENGAITGEMESMRGGMQELSGTYNKETGAISWTVETSRGEREYDGKIEGGKISGTMSAGGGRFEVEFEAERDKTSRNVSRRILVPSVMSFVATLEAGAYSSEDPVSGSWEGTVTGDELPGGSLDFTFELTLEDETKVTGTVSSAMGDLQIDEGSFDADEKAMRFVAYDPDNDMDLIFECKLDGDSLAGTVGDSAGQIEFDYTATRTSKPDSAEEAEEMVEEEPAEAEQQGSDEQAVEEEADEEAAAQEAVAGDEDICGTWNATIESDDIPGGSMEFSIEFARKSGKLTGVLSSMMGELEVDGIEYDAEKKTLKATAYEPEAGMEMDIEATINGESVEGRIIAGGGQMEIEFTGERVSGPEAAEEEAADDADEEVVEEEQQESLSDEAPAATTDDPVSGQWTGTLMRPDGNEGDLSVNLKREGSNITGTFETSRGEGEITDGSFDAEKGALTLVSENDNFSLDFVGKVEGNSYKGEMEFNGGQFSMEFELTRTSAPAVAESQPQQRQGRGQRGGRRGQRGESSSSGETLADLMPGPRWVSSIEASHHEEGRVYISFDGHRSNDDMPYAFVSEDFGKTWRSVVESLPETAGSVRVLREDIENENLLFLGCEFSAWFSLDRGQTWAKFTGLPTVAVHELAVHPQAGEIVAATHGRSIWIANIEMLRETTASTLSSAAYLYQPSDVIRWQRAASRGDAGTHVFRGEDASRGAMLQYSLGENARTLELTVSTWDGEIIKRFEDLERTQGLHQVEWDLRRDSGGNRGGRRGGGATGSTGSYVVTLTVDGQTLTRKLDIVADPERPDDAVQQDEMLEYFLELGEGAENDRN
ncbi:MAG: PDZ domain-containing protein [Planctomycetota bacterium]